MKLKERLFKEITPIEYWAVLNSFGAAFSLYVIVGGSGISYETMGVPLFILLATSIGCPVWTVCRKISRRYKGQIETFERKAKTLFSKCTWFVLSIALFCLSERAGKLRLMKNLLRSNGEVKEIVDTSISWEEAEGLKDRLKADSINDIPIKEIAVSADCSNWYTVLYTYLSQMAAHPTPLSLDNYLFAPDGEDVQEFLWGPDVFGIGCILSAAVESFIVVLKGVSNVFEKDWSSVLDSLHGRLAALSKPEDGFSLVYKSIPPTSYLSG